MSRRERSLSRRLNSAISEQVIAPLAAQFIAEVYPEVSPLVNIDNPFDNGAIMISVDVIP